MIFDRIYDRSDFVRLLQTRLCPDFVVDTKSLSCSRKTKFVDNGIIQIGLMRLSDGIEVPVRELEQESTNDPRISVTKDAFKLLHDHQKDNALIVFWNKDNSSRRLSLLMSTYEGRSKTNSNPKRYSFLLGPGEKTKTPQRYLIDRGPIKNLGDLTERFDVEVVREEFFNKYINLFLELYKEVNTEDNKKILNLNPVSFTKKLLGKLIFLYFLQKKNRLGAPADKLITEGDPKFMEKLYADYIGERKFVRGERRNFYNDYLEPLFYKALSEERNVEVFEYFGIKIPYLNGGLFQKEYNRDGTKFVIDDKVFRNDKHTGILDIFDLYNFTIYEDDPYDREIAVDPEMLGKIFENMISISSDNIDEIIKLFDSKKNGINGKEIAKDINKKFGAYYTPREVVHYITKEALLHHIINHLKEARKHLSEEELHSITRDLFDAKEQHLSQEYLKGKQETDQSAYDRFESIAIKVNDILKTVKVLDPAVGSGAFPMGILIEIFGLRSYLRDTFHLDTDLTDYDVKKSIIENNVFGVDIEPGAIDIARLRFWLSLVVDASKPEPLPNLEFKFVSANTLGILGSENEKSIYDKIELSEYKKLIHKYYNPKNQNDKNILKDKIIKILGNANHLYASEWTKKLLTFKPFTQGNTAIFFDSQLMFDEKEFDIIIGNPPYSGITNNPGLYEDDKIGVGVYKYVDGVHFGERKHWLNDDYVKFFRFAEHQMEQQKLGVVAMITNHGYIDNPTFRGMRRHLMQTYSQIINIDLHGNANKKETCLDGSKDENVFDIKQGVAMSIMIKNDMITEKILHKDIFGLRGAKLLQLTDHDFHKKYWNILTPVAGFFFFLPQIMDGSQYDTWAKLDEIFDMKNVGFISGNDRLNISFTKEEQEKKLKDLLDMNEIDWREKYSRPKDSMDWTYQTAISDLKANLGVDKSREVTYRPFDFRRTFYTLKSKGLYSRPSKDVLRHMLFDNIGIVCGKQNKSNITHFFCSSNIIDFNLTGSAGAYGSGSLFPLYLYSDDGLSRKVNIRTIIIDQINEKYDLTESNEELSLKIVSYIYSILYSGLYREQYSEFLKSDFPRIPFIDNKEKFLELVALGSKLIDFHLLKQVDPIIGFGDFKGVGNNIVEKILYTEDKLFINKTQYFCNISVNVREFMIGGYQVLDKRLKSRKNRILTNDDILYLQKVSRSLSHTIDMMKQIDQIIVNAGGF